MQANSPELLLLGVAVLLSFFVGKAAGVVRLPSLIGFMVAGILLGPSVLSRLDTALLSRLVFITHIALGFVGFSIGSELNLRALRSLGFGIVVIIIAESLAAFLVVLGATYLLTRDLALALVFGAMAPASAPAGTVAVIQECKARGSLTRALYAVVGFDDGFAIVIFGFAAAFARSLLLQEASVAGAGLLSEMWQPTREILLSLMVGGVGGISFGVLVGRLRSPRDILILLAAFVFIVTGFSVRFHLSLILANMTMGLLVANTCREALVQRVAEQLQAMLPLLFVLFFCLAGANLELRALPSLGLVGIVYILGRSAGLIGGARVGAMVGRSEQKIKKYLGLGILSQAGVAIGLALIVKSDFGRIGTEHALRIGASAITTITATSVVFEIVGPILTRIGLQRAGEAQPEAS
jgi:Kef-type K+ transport system membrane component KefB